MTDLAPGTSIRDPHFDPPECRECGGGLDENNACENPSCGLYPDPDIDE